MERRIMIFGAGASGRHLFEQMNAGQVDYFIDNDENKCGKEFCGRKVISVKEAYRIKDDYHIAIYGMFADDIVKQLENEGFTDYSVVKYDFKFNNTKELVVNGFKCGLHESTEDGKSEPSYMFDMTRETVNREAAQLYGKHKMFDWIEIETINKCNGICSFCPVNVHVDPRKEELMSWDMFKNIIAQLEEINFTGKISLFSNNEPLLDDRIVELNRYAREHLPNAYLYLFSNATLMTIDIFKELMESLDELIIDNYQKDQQLIKPCKEIVEYCKDHPELNEKVTIIIRNPNEILTTRGGTAPNCKEMTEYPNDRCMLPFCQVVVRPSGQLSLCCNDAIGKYTLGDLNKEKLIDIWNGQRYETVRKCLNEGRANWGNCKYCDTFIVRRPKA